MALDERGNHQAHEPLHQMDALLDGMIDPEQLEPLVQEQKRLSRKVG